MTYAELSALVKRYENALREIADSELTYTETRTLRYIAQEALKSK